MQEKHTGIYYLRNNAPDLRCVKALGIPFSIKSSQHVGVLSGTLSFAFTLARRDRPRRHSLETTYGSASSSLEASRLRKTLAMMLLGFKACVLQVATMLFTTLTSSSIARVFCALEA